MYPVREEPGSGLIPYNLAISHEFNTLLILNNKGPIYLPLNDNVKIKYFNYWEKAFPKKLNINIIRTSSLILLKLIGSISLTLKALPSIIRFKPDIIHIHSPLQILLAIASKLCLKVPLVITYHGTDFNRLRRNKFFLRIINLFVDHTISISEDFYDEIIKVESVKNVSYVPNGVDLSLFKKSNIEKSDQIITVGRLVWQKGLPFLIEAFARYVKIYPNSKLLIVGEGEEKNNLVKLVDRLKINNNVIFTGLLNQEDIVLKLNQSKFFIMPSISEGFPKALIEAMACGLACITTDVGSCKSIIKGAGITIKKENSEQLFKAMVELKKNKFLRDNYEKEAIKLSKQYSWNSRSKKVENLYKSMLKNV